jgi:hypothetical protein
MDKLSRRDVKELKDRPIAQGIISNTIFQVGWNGISFIIGLVARHYALIWGTPPHWAILIGAVVFFLIALSYNLFKGRSDEKLLTFGTAQYTDAEQAEIQSRPVTEPLELNAAREKIKELEGEVEEERTTAAHFEEEVERLSFDLNGLNSRFERQLEEKNEQIKRLNIAVSNEKFAGEVLKKGLEQKGKELVEVKEKLAIDTLNATKEIEELRSEITQLKGYVRHTEQYRALREAADIQRRNIDGRVKLEKVTLGDLTLAPKPGHPRSVKFGLYITNNSMWDISFKNELGGVIRFEGTDLEEHKKVINSVKDLPIGHTGCLTIEQRLSLSDVQIISEARHAIGVSNFYFENLIIIIEAGQRALEIEEKQLDMNSAKLPAFPVELEVRGQRIRAFAEIRGSCVQLHEPLRIGDGPLEMGPVENWQNRSLETLRKVFNDGAADTLWRKITHGVPFPSSSASSQRDWLQGCIVVLGGLLADETGEYIRSTKDD